MIRCLDTSFSLLSRSLIRTFELRSKVLPLGKTQINLVFRSLIRTFALSEINNEKLSIYDEKELR